ncbi:MAG TPA: polysaccharide biosynthesis tyrosine autokinase [Candidatus Paceibacterota bacterium]|nr:polysaccharide biosynthesis tyrosine autokinase [Verrucomicrobiota bacterium]HRZ47579.1 polysaccharide biosynthesis tyrosine autokinase [Candidatus Paceibacterota bacterium]HRZ93383.1 polysaccharide biosynthesis tyrosine autokinase [Candidatus Paceibacterota bacterium]
MPPPPSNPEPLPSNGDGQLTPVEFESMGMAPPSRFEQTSRLHARLHRIQLVLRKHWWLLPFCLAITLAPVSWYAYRLPTVYTSSGKMWVSGKLNIKEGQLYSEELSSFMGTQTELMRSATIQQRAFEKLSRNSPAATNAFESSPFDVAIEVAPKAAVFTIRATGPDPDSTRAYVNALMEEYITFKKEVRNESSDVTLASITEQVNQLETDLRGQQERMHNFLMSNNVVFLQEQGSSAGSYLAQLNKQLAAIETELKLLQMLTPEQLTQIGSSPVDPAAGTTPSFDPAARSFAQSMAGPQAEYYKATQQIEILKAKRAELGQFLRPNHPKMIKMDEDISSQEKLIQVFREQGQIQLADRRQSLDLQITNLQSSIVEWEAKALAANRKMAEYERIRQDVQRTQGLYERLLSVIQNVDVNKTLDQESVQIMERAGPASPSASQTRLIAMGALGGLFLGLFILLLIERFDDKFASISELRSQFSELVIGQLPQMPHVPRNGKMELIHPNDDRHSFVESFRNLRSSLLYLVPKEQHPRTVLVTSAVPEEGKTTVTANLALTLAVAGSRVLLVDADLRRAAIHKMFDREPIPGLSEILRQEANWRAAIQSSKTANLWLLPAGEVEENPGELFLSPAADLFLREIYAEYDYILMDSAPVLAADDTSSLAPKVDGVLFVVRSGYTSARMARAALDLLEQRRTSILGLVFNRAATTSSEYYYYYRYSDYYHSKPGSRKSRRPKPELQKKQEP